MIASKVNINDPGQRRDLPKTGISMSPIVAWVRLVEADVNVKSRSWTAMKTTATALVRAACRARYHGSRQLYLSMIHVQQFPRVIHECQLTVSEVTRLKTAYMSMSRILPS